MALHPRAKRLYLPENDTQPRITPRLVVVHSQAGTGSLRGFFGGSSSLESTFWIGLDGTIEQYVDSSVRADANYLANGWSGSIETENHREHVNRGSWDDDPWTPAQVASITDVLDWYARTHRVPRRLANAWDGSGFGWHIQYRQWHKPAKACPGRRRIEQFKQIIIPALAGSYNGGVPVTNADKLQIIAGVDSILKDDFRKLKDELNADITNAANRVVRDLGGKPSVPNKR